MDFSAWFEVYLGGRWYTFDARHNMPRIGRILMARGRDATDVALSTSFGPSHARGLQGDHRRAAVSAFEQAGPPVVVVNETGRSPFVLLCEHASRLFPAGYGRLGLPAAELDRHIAWDLGAAEVAMRLACILDAPLFLAGYSRLLIDLNRPPESPTSIPRSARRLRSPAISGSTRPSGGAGTGSGSAVP